jgi:hypothetical protein
MANTWQGEFPIENLELDGYAGTAPVGRYPANGYGLYDMIGNVWEWTADWYQAHGDQAHACCTATNPRGGERERSTDPHDRAAIPRKVMKGGSHLCAPNYCRRYRPAARMAHPVDPAPPTWGSAASSEPNPARTKPRERKPPPDGQRPDPGDPAATGRACLGGRLGYGRPGPASSPVTLKALSTSTVTRRPSVVVRWAS